jgi:hypothetical protein
MSSQSVRWVLDLPRRVVIEKTRPMTELLGNSTEGWADVVLLMADR